MQPSVQLDSNGSINTGILYDMNSIHALMWCSISGTSVLLLSSHLCLERNSRNLSASCVSDWHFVVSMRSLVLLMLNPLTPNDHYSGRTAPLTSKRCILYIYSTNTGTEHFKHGIYSPFFPLQNAVCFIILTYLVPVLFTFYIQVC